MANMRLVLLLGYILVLFAPGCARVGIDLSRSISTSTAWAAYFDAADLDESFGIIQAVFYNGTLNPSLVQTIRSAWRAGTKDISLYVYPCVDSSPYAINNDLSCGTPEYQLDTLVEYLRRYNITFRPHSLSESDSTSSNSTDYFALDYTPFYDTTIPNYNTSNIQNITLQSLFVNVEDTMPNYYFSYLHYANVEFLWRYNRYAQEVYGIEVGFYTNYYTWLDIMTDFRQGQRVYYHSANETQYATKNPFAQQKLWVPRFDADNSMSFFRPFADWQTVYMKQTSGGSTEARRLGSTRVCTNYIVSAANATTVSAT